MSLKPLDEVRSVSANEKIKGLLGVVTAVRPEDAWVTVALEHADGSTETVTTPPEHWEPTGAQRPAKASAAPEETGAPEPEPAKKPSKKPAAPAS